MKTEFTKDDIHHHDSAGNPIAGSGMTFATQCEYDQTMGPPWKEHDGHGDVSEWTSRDKRAGEWVLSSDAGRSRYYDAAGAMKKARADGWGLTEVDKARLAKRLGRQPTKGEICAESVRQDFENLKDWCEDRWHWIGVVVTIYSEDGTELACDSVWGIESYTDYWREVAAGILSELLCTHSREAAERSHWEARDVETITT